MPIIFCIGGVAGSGKSHFRTGHPVLSSLPFLDFSDDFDPIFESAAHAHTALRQAFLKRIEDQILRAPEMSLVAEAFFAPGRAQRSLVELLADRRGFGVR